jgi:ABC-2 type transport system ATP-binding protein
MLLLKNLVKKYNKVPVLNIASFDLDHGMYWLKGANGSGKSTLLKIIAGIIPFEGNVILDAISLKSNPVAFKNKVSYHPADAALPPFITGLELLQFYDAIRNKNANSEVAFIIDLFQLSAYVHNKTGSYSSGMQKKLSLALAFIGKPKLIMLDEPLSTLDTAVTKLITDIIALYFQQGTAFIITSHQDFEYKSIDFSGILQIGNTQIQKLF